MPIRIGQAAPDFTLTGAYDQTISTYALRDFQGQWLVLFFYPADFTFICPTEVIGFSKRAPEFRSIGTEILGVSVDSVETHQEWIKELGGVNYPLLSDAEKKVSRAFGVLDEKEGVALRATFVIDPQGVIQSSTITQYNVGRSVEETLRIVRALQTGRLCPADWKPGEETFESSSKF